MEFLTKLTQLDRRWIFVLVAIFVITPQLAPISLPMSTTPPVESVFNHIESLNRGDRVFIALDYSPSSEAELYPMTLALMRHCFEKKLRVLSCTLVPSGRGIINRTFTQMESEYQLVHGKDYANYGFQVGYQLVVMQAGEDFAGAFPKAKAMRTDDMEISRDIKRLADIDYFIDLASIQSLDAVWIGYGVGWYDITLGGGCTAVSATQYYPYLDTGQINGLIGGLKGAAEYEKLVDDKYSEVANPERVNERDKAGRTFLGNGTSGMGSQSLAHVLIIFLVLFNNIIYFAMKKKK